MINRQGQKQIRNIIKSMRQASDHPRQNYLACILHYQGGDHCSPKIENTQVSKLTKGNRSTDVLPPHLHGFKHLSLTKILLSSTSISNDIDTIYWWTQNIFSSFHLANELRDSGIQVVLPLDQYFSNKKEGMCLMNQDIHIFSGNQGLCHTLKNFRTIMGDYLGW